MQPQVDLESRLATVLMAELMHPELGGNVADIDDTFVDIVLDDLELEGNDDYASYELVFGPLVSDASPTIEFVRVRDTTQDHVITVEFGRESVEEAPDRTPARPAAPLAALLVAPAVPTGLASSPPRVARVSDAFRVPLYSAPYERVDIHEHRSWFAAEATEIITDPPIGLGIALYAS
jgi:hypothetical protein